MNWPSFLTPWWALAGLLALPIIALYILRQKRPDFVISSTLLWSKTMADMRASSPWQRLRRNLLLLLQLLILAALVFVLMRPIIQAQASTAKAGVIVIDCTASMQTADNGGPTRLDRAKEEARKLVDGMRPGDRFLLIADGGGLTQVRSGFSSSKIELKQLIDQITPSDTGSDLSESLLMAASSLRALGSEAEKKSEAITAGKVWLFSDGAGVRVPDIFGQSADMLQFVKIGDSDNSVGITRLAISPLPKKPGIYEVFVGLQNASSAERKISVALALNTPENLLPDQAKFAVVPPRGTGGVVFENVKSEPGKLYVRLDDHNDDFLLDNTAYAMIEPPRKTRLLLVTKGNYVLESFAKTMQRVSETEAQIVVPGAYNTAMPADLTIFDNTVPKDLPKGDTMFVRPPGSVSRFKVTAEIENPLVLRRRFEDPLMAFVELSDLRIGKALMLERDPEATELLGSTETPLITYRDLGPARHYFVGFSPTLESNWWQHPSLLIFLQNVLDQTRQRHFIGAPQIVPAGQSARLYEVEGQVRIQTPSGEMLEQPADRGALEFAATDKVGFYTVSTGEKRSAFAVNLLSTTESAIVPQSLQNADGGNIQEAAGVAMVNKEIWPWLAVAALVVLLVEWFVYHRRVA